MLFAEEVRPEDDGYVKQVKNDPLVAYKRVGHARYRDQQEYDNEFLVTISKTEYTLGDQFGHLAFFVDDLEPVVREVERRGWWYRSSRPETGSKYIFVKDPNGYDVEILERR